MSFFPTAQKARVRALGLTIAAQNAPASSDSVAWAGDPCTEASTQQNPALVTTSIVDRALFKWVPRYNALGLSNTRPNQIAPIFGVGQGSLLRRSRCIDWQTAYAYVVGQTVYDSGTVKSYAANTAHTSGASFAGDASKWTQVTGTAATPECREEYTSYVKAIAALVGYAMQQAGEPEINSGAGYGDILTAAGVTYYSDTYTETNKDTLFVNYPIDLTGLNALTYATTRDVVVLPASRLVDIHSDWATSTSMTYGTVRRDTGPTPPTFWACNTAHTSANSGTFAQDRAAAAAGKWTQIRISLNPDWEPSDDRYKNSSDDPSGAKNQNTVYALTAIYNSLNPKGYKLVLYTNDIDSLNPVAGHNGLSEANINQVLGVVDVFQPVVDDSNLRGNSLVATFTANYNQLRYTNGDPAQAQRSNFSNAKVSFVVEMVDREGNRAFPVTAMSVGAGPSYNVTLTAPGNTLSGSSYVNIVGPYGTSVSDLTGTFFITNRSGDTFRLSRKVSSVNDLTAAVTESTYSGQALGSYTGGAVIGNGGTSLRSVIRLKRVSRKYGVKYLNLWRNNADQTVPTLDWAEFTISGITNANPAVVTVTSAHGLTTATSDAAVSIDGVLGMTNVNRGVFTVGTILSSTTFSLSGYDSTILPAYGGGGTVRVTRRSRFNRKLGVLAYGWYVPKPPSCLGAF